MCEIRTFEVISVDISKKLVTARKDRSCSECGTNPGIKAGEKYTRYFGKSDGVTHRQDTCGPCQAARDEYCEHHPNGQYLFGELEQEILDCLYEEPSSEEWIANRWTIVRDEDGCIEDLTLKRAVK